MKRLVVTGLPCPPEPWEAFFGKHKGQRILPLLEVLENTDASDLKTMSRYVADQITAFEPASIVCHDFGVPLTLLALLYLQRKGKSPDVKITLFNGAFRRLDIFKSPIPFRIQLMTLSRAIKEVESCGGHVDLRLKEYLPRIRAMNRLVIAYSLADKMLSKLGLDEFMGYGGKPLIRSPIQIIASTDDPYIPFESIEQLRLDFSPQRMVKVQYGHFPYSVPRDKIVPLIEEFEGHSA